MTPSRIRFYLPVVLLAAVLPGRAPAAARVPAGGTSFAIAGFMIQSSAAVAEGGSTVSTPGYSTRGWYPVAPRSTVFAGLLQHGRRCDDGADVHCGLVERAGSVEPLLNVVGHRRRYGPFTYQGRQPGWLRQAMIAFASGADPRIFVPCGPGRVQLGTNGPHGTTPL